MEKIVRILSNFYWHCMDLVSCKIERVAKTYERSISSEYRRESEIFDIPSNKNTLHIGCGAYPITAMTFAKTNGGNIVGIDKNQKFVKLASHIINKKNLQEKVKIDCGNGVNYPVENFDIIIISSCSHPKVEILHHVFKTAKPQSKIIVRERELATKSVINCIDSHNDIEIVKKMKNNPFPFFGPFGWQSFYLIKK